MSETLFASLLWRRSSAGFKVRTTTTARMAMIGIAGELVKGTTIDPNKLAKVTRVSYSAKHALNAVTCAS